MQFSRVLFFCSNHFSTHLIFNLCAEGIRRAGSEGRSGGASEPAPTKPAGAALESSIRPSAVGKADLETPKGFQAQIKERADPMKKTALKKRTILLALLLLCMAVGLGGTCLAEEGAGRGAGSADPLRRRTNEGDRTKSRGTEKPWFPACTAPGTTVSFRAQGPVRPGAVRMGRSFLSREQQAGEVFGKHLA